MKSEWYFGIGGLVLGIAGTLFIMHFLVGANAWDSESMYMVEIGDEKVSCLTLGSVQQVCNMSREVLEYAVEQERQTCSEGLKGMYESFQAPEGCDLIILGPNAKAEVCEGDALYTRIKEEYPYD